MSDKAPKYIPKSSLEIFSAKMPSGIQGWRARLRANYANSLAQFETYSRIYNLVERLGYKTLQEAWDANPVIQGSVNPSDFGKYED